MLAETRRARIIDILGRSQDGVVSIENLSRQFGVSEMTIRRDLDWLATRAMVTRVRGGAVAHSSRDEKPFGDRLGDHGPQKTAIAWAAARLVNDGDRIILDAGTTTQQIASALITRPRLTVITNNVAAVAQLSRAPQIDTILLGGNLKHQELCTVGPLVTQGLAVLSADKLFLSTAGFAVPQGATDPDMAEAEVKRAMISAASEVILVADSSKWGQVQLVKTARLNEISRLVTDDNIPVEAISALQAAGVEVVTPASLADASIAGSDPERLQPVGSL
jgi:DeoR/GlpR family transcriptional regulator of sugar metabolism